MFALFSVRLYGAAADLEYQLITTNGEITTASHWIMQKVEMATLVTVHVIDATRTDMTNLLAYDKETRKNAEKLLTHVGQVANIYVLAGGAPPALPGIEEYFGQQIYSVFWHINLKTGDITVPKGQPKKIFNVRQMVETACKEANAADANSGAAGAAGATGATGAAGALSPALPETFREITGRASANRPSPKYRHPLFSYLIILANAVILGLMYIEGYVAGDVYVAIRFGAIVSDYVIYYGEWYRLFAAMFIHFGFAHLFMNAFGIIIFGSRVERYFGRVEFLLIYVLSGLTGSVFRLIHSYFFQADIIIVSAGASGAVYGIVGAMFAYTRITRRTIDFINWYIMLIYIGIGMAMGVATPGIDNIAHLGGLVGGLIIGGCVAKFRKSVVFHPVKK
ncbi:MAG: rhomboid family intramembrane serine protease [Defluviitaleaceae bacterium]|nr:rhomboid family intramembrane serine protease [Defluviitaleaceae bacterium]